MQNKMAISFVQILKSFWIIVEKLTFNSILPASLYLNFDNNFKKGWPVFKEY